MISPVFFVCVFVAFGTVVIASPVDKDEPAFSCPPGEFYEKCSQIICYKNCTHLKTPPACPSVSADCFNPACECERDTLRDAEGNCIPTKQCPEYDGISVYN